MSGGRFDYKDSDLKYSMFGWCNKHEDKYNAKEHGDPMQDRELSELVFDVLNLIHDLDWYLSGDTCERTYNKSKAAFKKKWIHGDRNDRLTRMVEDMFKETKDECLKLIR